LTLRGEPLELDTLRDALAGFQPVWDQLSRDHGSPTTRTVVTRTSNCGHAASTCWPLKPMKPPEAAARFEKVRSQTQRPAPDHVRTERGDDSVDEMRFGDKALRVVARIAECGEQVAEVRQRGRGA
jgi:hypothetical protein